MKGPAPQLHFQVLVGLGGFSTAYKKPEMCVMSIFFDQRLISYTMRIKGKPHQEILTTSLDNVVSCTHSRSAPGAFTVKFKGLSDNAHAHRLTEISHVLLSNGGPREYERNALVSLLSSVANRTDHCYMLVYYNYPSILTLLGCSVKKKTGVFSSKDCVLLLTPFSVIVKNDPSYVHPNAVIPLLGAKFDPNGKDVIKISIPGSIAEDPRAKPPMSIEETNLMFTFPSEEVRDLWMGNILIAREALVERISIPYERISETNYIRLYNETGSLVQRLPHIAKSVLSPQNPSSSGSSGPSAPKGPRPPSHARSNSQIPESVASKGLPQPPKSPKNFSSPQNQSHQSRTVTTHDVVDDSAEDDDDDEDDVAPPPPPPEPIAVPPGVMVPNGCELYDDMNIYIADSGTFLGELNIHNPLPFKDPLGRTLHEIFTEPSSNLPEGMILASNGLIYIAETRSLRGSLPGSEEHMLLYTDVNYFNEEKKAYSRKRALEKVSELNKQRSESRKANPRMSVVMPGKAPEAPTRVKKDTPQQKEDAEVAELRAKARAKADEQARADARAKVQAEAEAEAQARARAEAEAQAQAQTRTQIQASLPMTPEALGSMDLDDMPPPPPPDADDDLPPPPPPAMESYGDDDSFPPTLPPAPESFEDTYCAPLQETFRESVRESVRDLPLPQTPFMPSLEVDTQTLVSTPPSRVDSPIADTAQEHFIQPSLPEADSEYEANEYSTGYSSRALSPRAATTVFGFDRDSRGSESSAYSPTRGSVNSPSSSAVDPEAMLDNEAFLQVRLDGPQGLELIGGLSLSNLRFQLTEIRKRIIAELDSLPEFFTFLNPSLGDLPVGVAQEDKIPLYRVFAREPSSNGGADIISVTIRPAKPPQQPLKFTSLTIRLENVTEPLGLIEVSSRTGGSLTLANLRETIDDEIDDLPEEYFFLWESVRLSKKQEAKKFLIHLKSADIILRPVEQKKTPEQMAAASRAAAEIEAPRFNRRASTRMGMGAGPAKSALGATNLLSAIRGFDTRGALKKVEETPAPAPVTSSRPAFGVSIPTDLASRIAMRRSQIEDSDDEF